jgi:hypothetical protein
MNKRELQVKVEVETTREPINLQSWAGNYVRHVLALEGVTPSSDRGQPTVFAEAG